MVDADAITTVRYIVEACQRPREKHKSKDDDDDDDTRDGAVVMEKRPMPQLMVELVKASNVKFLSHVVSVLASNNKDQLYHPHPPLTSLKAPLSSSKRHRTQAHRSHPPSPAHDDNDDDNEDAAHSALDEGTTNHNNDGLLRDMPHMFEPAYASGMSIYRYIDMHGSDSNIGIYI